MKISKLVFYAPGLQISKYRLKNFEPKFCTEENSVKLYIYSVSVVFLPGLPPLPPGTKYGLKKFEPKIWAEENLVRLYIYLVSVVFPPGLPPLTPSYKIWI